MAWDLSLWCPLPYIDVHPFDIKADDRTRVFRLTRQGQEMELHLSPQESVRQAAGLGNSVQSTSDFTVIIDDLELRRPIRMRNLPATSSAVKAPLLFVANELEQFTGVDIEMSGGNLAFQAYLMWAPKIVPNDNQGVLIRVHDATGALFDPTFLNFPAAEQRRLTQITCEVFVTQGFDGAINIDRESFNYAHPHVVTLTKWLHTALRRLIAVQKRVAAAALSERRSEGAKQQESLADEITGGVWRKRRGDDGTQPPVVVFSDRQVQASTDDTYLFPRSRVVGDFSGPNSRQRREATEARLEKIVQILAAYDCLDFLSTDEQANMLTAIREILQAYE